MKRHTSMVLGIALLVAACAVDRPVDAGDDAGLTLSSSAGPANAAPAAERAYRVTIDNLTGGQPFSPGIAATHTKQQAVFRVGWAASEGVRLIAENGDPSTALAELTGAPGLHSTLATSAPVGCIGCAGPFGTTLSFDIAAAANANRFSLAIMLICTNDGFTGLDAVKLPGGFQPAVHYAAAYDAGTEANDELWTSIVDPCGGIGPVAASADGSNDRPATNGVVTMHPGIQGGGDLTDAHGWENPVARITIQRLK